MMASCSFPFSFTTIIYDKCKNMSSLKVSLKQLKEELATLKEKLDTYFQVGLSHSHFQIR